MPSPNWSERRHLGGSRPDGAIRIEHGIDRVVHLPPDTTRALDLYQGIELSPASQGTVDWLDALYPARGVDAFLARELDLPIAGHLLLAPTFNHLLESAMADLEGLCAGGHPAEPLITGALGVLRTQGQLRDLLDRYRNALLEA